MSAALPTYRTDANGVRWSDIRPYQPSALEAPQFPWFAAADIQRASPGFVTQGQGDAAQVFYSVGVWLFTNPYKYGAVGDALTITQWQSTGKSVLRWDNGAVTSYPDGAIISGTPPTNADAGVALIDVGAPLFLGSTNYALLGDWQEKTLPDRFIFGIKTAPLVRTDVAYLRVGDWFVPYVYAPRQVGWDTNSNSWGILLSFAALVATAGFSSPWAAGLNLTGRIASQITGNPYAGALLNFGVNYFGAPMDTIDTTALDTSSIDTSAVDLPPLDSFDTSTVFESGFPSVTDTGGTAFESNFPTDTVIPDITANDVASINSDFGVSDFPAVVDTAPAVSDQIASFDGSIGWLTETAKDTASSFDLGKFVTAMASIYANYRLRADQLAQRGQTLAAIKSPTPGIVKTLPDGSTLRTNADGSTTVRKPDGSGYLIRPDGSIVPALPGSLAPPTGIMSTGGIATFIGQHGVLIGVGLAAVLGVALLAKGRK